MVQQQADQAVVSTSWVRENGSSCVDWLCWYHDFCQSSYPLEVRQSRAPCMSCFVLGEKSLHVQMLLSLGKRNLVQSSKPSLGQASRTAPYRDHLAVVQHAHLGVVEVNAPLADALTQPTRPPPSLIQKKFHPAHKSITSRSMLRLSISVDG